MSNKLASKYSFIKNYVIKRGFTEEISWQANVCFNELDERIFLREIAWVILSSGMKETIIRNIFDKISESFFNWTSSKLIIKNKDKCFYKAIKCFNNKNKISAIIMAAEKVNKIGFHQLKKIISENPIDKLQEFYYIGPVTVYHLVKNIGLPYAKPDRHLKRIAKKEGYSDVQKFCNDVSILTGDSKPVVDIVFWRFATITPDYLNVLSIFDEEYDNFVSG
ncbi:hypothetical protein [Methanobacterium formicicum]|uniref:HhH-GPD domain-containing protein n=1 Tax=Methanobacterium formicicum (strain DSM 3637 / PP1) TaxID=1204725 RepID=K2R016_METFP|nr:hypothetical protein [Methanobacterium formicicum]EKF85858.1 hypothetical protein A994_07250 [Methanobacterium formicicum DSM 3637]